MLNDFKALKLTLASPQQIINWSHGEVKKAETINYRTHKAEVDGLMDEKIFGPTKNYECYCGKYKKIRYKGIICDKCGVEVTHKRVRRERIGHIKLASPVTHVWYAYGVPNKLALVLNIPQKKLETVIYFSRYIVTSCDDAGKEQAQALLLEAKNKAVDEIKVEEDQKIAEIQDKYKEELKNVKKKAKDESKLDLQLERLKANEKKEIAKLKSIYDQRIQAVEKKHATQSELIEDITEGTTLSEEEFAEISDLGVDFFEAAMGAEAIHQLLGKIDVKAEIDGLKEEIAATKSQLRMRKLIQRLRVFEGMGKNGIDPKWMVMQFLPVLPPDLRPIIQLPGGRFATSDLNDLYRRVINRNNRLKRLIDLGAPEIILRNEKRMLQEAVDALIDNSHRPGSPVQNSRQQPYKSLSDMLRGKQGRFRQNLLGKRVDFSGRSVIVAGPELSVYQCGLPKTMALELFKPFVMHEIIAQGLAANIKSAKNFFEEKSDAVWDILENVIQGRPVLLNRAPTLHKQGIQAFYPVLIEGNAIKLHPLVCKGFNADFDGDQMAVHVPLSEKAIEEVKARMFASNNILLMADGKPVINTEKDMAYGVYYLTGVDEKASNPTRSFTNVDRAIGAFNAKEIGLREQVYVLVEDKVQKTTVGRLIFNRSLPTGYGFVNEQLNKKGIAKISARILDKFGGEEAIGFLDNMERLGFKYATASGFSIGMEDFVVSSHKDELLAKVAQKEEELMSFFEQGLLTNAERRKLFEEAWINIVDEVSKTTWAEYSQINNNLVKLNESGAAPVENPLRQISGVRGLIIDPSGHIVELPLRSNYKQGLTSLEYFVAARGTRKALADVALKTAESGYLTRKLVDVAQDVITRIPDCGTTEGIYLRKSEDRRIDFEDRISGRWSAEAVKNTKGEELVGANQEITAEIASQIAKEESVLEVKVRSVLTCESHNGICAACYGDDLGTKRQVKIGMAVGVIAAQAMGEASTQLTLHAKHRAGSAAVADITQGLPRVEELFEVRTPKGKAVLAEIPGKVSLHEDEVLNIVRINVTNKAKFKQTYDITDAQKVVTKKSKQVKSGATLFIDKDGNDVTAEVGGTATVKGTELTIEGTADDVVSYEIANPNQILVKDGDSVAKGQQLTQGSIDPKELMVLRDLRSAQEYIINEIQATYGVQGIGIDDKHVEVAVKQMSRFMLVMNPGESEYLPGDYVDNQRVIIENAALEGSSKKPIVAKRQLMGLSNASLRTESFLSAASFQDQVRVLTDASIIGKVDVLSGLKENVIIGRPVPLGEEVR
jgi:DNA-directed RNA polymerase subunit beta'